MRDSIDSKLVTRFSEWLLKYIPEFRYQTKEPRIAEIGGDAGFRRYYRVNSQPTRIGVISPPEKENNLEFVQIANLLRDNGVAVPKIFAVCFEKGFLLVEDFGDTTFFEALKTSNSDALYDQAEKSLFKMQQIYPSESSLVTYDLEKVLDELALFEAWFLKAKLGIPSSEIPSEILRECFQKLIDNFNEQPQTFVHRDYHSRNIMVKQDKSLGVIDFQDALIGPITYDLVSLYRDCYLELDQDYIRRKLLNYKDRLELKKVIPRVSNKTFERWFDLTGLQRHLKVLGIFSRLAIRDQKTAYLRDIPLVMTYVRLILDRYDEFSLLQEWIEKCVYPALQKQT